jgi:hypothetical protein
MGSTHVALGLDAISYRLGRIQMEIFSASIRFISLKQTDGSTHFDPFRTVSCGRAARTVSCTGERQAGGGQRGMKVGGGHAACRRADLRDVEASVRRCWPCPHSHTRDQLAGVGDNTQDLPATNAAEHKLLYLGLY